LRFFSDAFQNRQAGGRNMMREAGRVSAFKNFFISRSAESFSLFVLESKSLITSIKRRAMSC